MCQGVPVYKVVSKMTSASDMFTDSKRSSTHGVTGTIMRITSSTEAAATQICADAAMRSPIDVRFAGAAATAM